MARSNLRDLKRCREACANDVNVLMLIAANDQVLGLYNESREAYQTALRIDRRPELYLQLGLVEWQLQDVGAARQHVAQAVSFNPSFLDSITDGMLRTEVDSLLQTQHQSRGQLLQNETFARSSPLGLRREFLGIGRGEQSAAERWFLFNNSLGRTVTEMALVRRDGSTHRVLRVATEVGFSGVIQTWASAGAGPSHVKTSAWIFVRRGRAMISSGELGLGQLDALSTQTGKWELLAGNNHSCPANHTRICSYDGPAEFYVDTVSVVAEPGPPCGG